MADVRDHVVTLGGVEDFKGALTLQDLGMNLGYAGTEESVVDSYLLEFDITNPVARFPRCFGKDYGGHIEEHVFLRDPKNNEFEVQVEVTNGKVFFKNGWFGLRDFYGIDIGAWVTLSFERPTLMLMTLKNRFDEEIEYPYRDSPIISRLDRDLCQRAFINWQYTADIVLGATDVETGFLILPWLGFCKAALPHFNTEIDVVDYLGFSWKCSLKFVGRKKNLVCRFGGEWGSVCRAHMFVEGHSLMLVVTGVRNNKVLYLRRLPRSSKPNQSVKPTNKIICTESGDAGFLLKGTSFLYTDEFVQRDMLKLNTYHLELDPETPKARLPSCFAKEYGVHVDDHVLLRDPNENMFEVRVHKKKGKVYFRDGWSQLKDFYKLKDRALITLTYTEPDLMLMTIREKSGLEVKYPNKSPPNISMMVGPKYDCALMRFYRSTVHVLCPDDICSGCLMVPMQGFCKEALPIKACNLIVVDEIGFAWDCNMKFTEVNGITFCRIGGDWSVIPTARGLRAGHAIKLAVSDEKRTGVVYPIHFPLKCIHRCFIKSPRTGNAKHVYQVNHYFMTCPSKRKRQ